MCKPKVPQLPPAPAPRAVERMPDRGAVQQQSAAKAKATYTPRGSLTAPGSIRRRAPTAILGATSTQEAPGVILGG